MFCTIQIALNCTQASVQPVFPECHDKLTAALTACVATAGASLTASYDGTIEQERVTSNDNTYQITVDGSLTATSHIDSTHTILLAYFGNSLASAVSSGTAYPLVAGVPADGCSPLSYPYKLPGKVVLLARGNCTYQTKVGTWRITTSHRYCATRFEQIEDNQSVCLSVCTCVRHAYVRMSRMHVVPFGCMNLTSPHKHTMLCTHVVMNDA